MTARTGIAVNAILKERERQETLKASGKFEYTCADLEMTLDECMLVLMEEVGELCRAILEYKMLTKNREGHLDTPEVGYAKVIEECDQVTAVALAIRERWVDRNATV